MSDDKKIQLNISKYLRKHPEFFLQYPDLLSELEVVSVEGKLTDLSTHQRKSLQNENRQLKNQITQLIKNAQQSESLMNRLFNLLTELSVVESSLYIPGFVSFVTEHFPVDYFKLLVAEGLVENHDSANIAVMNATHVKQFAVFQAKSEPLSGRLQQEKIASVFGAVDDIKSAVVLPIGNHAEYGLMVFASKDEEKFHPHSSSDILQKLCQILQAYFSQQRTEDENKAMS